MVPLRNSLFFICIIFGALRISVGQKDELFATLQNDFDAVMENETALRALSAILNAVKEVVENEVGSKMITGVMEQISSTLKHSRGSQSVHVILEALKTTLTDDTATQILSITSKDLQEIAVLPETTATVKMGSDLMTLFMKYDQSALLIDAYTDGLVSVIQLPEPKEKMITIFRNLRNIIFFKWFGANSGASPAP